MVYTITVWRVMGREIYRPPRWTIIFLLLRAVEHGDIRRVMRSVHRYGRRVLTETMPFVTRNGQVWRAVNAVRLSFHNPLDLTITTPEIFVDGPVGFDVVPVRDKYYVVYEYIKLRFDGPTTQQALLACRVFSNG
jgi:hypothetical protein